MPSRLTPNKKRRHVNLLLIQNTYHEDADSNNDDENDADDDNNFDKEENGEYTIRYHYVWIKNISRLISSSMSKHNGK